MKAWYTGMPINVGSLDEIFEELLKLKGSFNFGLWKDIYTRIQEKHKSFGCMLEIIH